MTDAVAAFPNTVPANTPVTGLLSVKCALGWSNVSKILISFPPGCSGLVGARLSYAGNPVYPIGPSSFFVLDDYVVEVDPTNQQQGGQWTFDAYNLDIYQHTPTAYFYFDYLPIGSAPGQSGLVSL